MTDYTKAIDELAYFAEEHAHYVSDMKAYFTGRLPWDHNENTMAAEHIERTEGRRALFLWIRDFT